MAVIRSTSGSAATGGCSSRMRTVQWQSGPPLGTPGGRWMGRTCARGFVATAVAVEGRILDVVAHALHHLVTRRADVGERAARTQPELAVALTVQPVADVQELVGKPHVELQALEDRRDTRPHEAHQPLHPAGVDGTRRHPLGDGQLVRLAHRVVRQHRRDRRTIVDVGPQHHLSRHHRECRPRQPMEREVRIERTRVLVHRVR
ncbi:MAG: hypothetical protein U5R31_07185 [Acidimicrobiia bacterium]|nr:hypothetical protein [Acidimicrobiia bacterium]